MNFWIARKYQAGVAKFDRKTEKITPYSLGGADVNLRTLERLQAQLLTASRACGPPIPPNSRCPVRRRGNWRRRQVGIPAPPWSSPDG